MHLPLVLLVFAAPPADLTFRAGRLDAWQGAGFQLTTATASGPSRDFAVSSDDPGPRGRKALLHQTFTVPAGVAAIRFTAAALRPKGREPGPTLDVVLEAAGREYVPKQVRTANGWKEAARLLPPENGRPREYTWSVAAHAGETVRIALIDDDERPGCHVFCSGFRFVSADEINAAAFAGDMERLRRERGLPPMTRLDSAHFLAVGDGDDDLIERRLCDCETLYAIFFDHFRRKGFPVGPPAERMMVAVFDSQEGFETYLGGRLLSPAVPGVYDRNSNRLVVYDCGRSRAYLDAQKHADEIARRIETPLDRQRFIGAFSRAARDWRDDADVGTVMHEAAHQLSFNGGLLEREGDVPIWLAEGLACYCESTADGAWQGVGEPNPRRVEALAAQLRAKGPLIPLQEMLRGDEWLRNGVKTGQGALPYAQSWALFRLLMEERPRELRRYLDLVRTRRTPDRRIDDFVEAFGSFAKMDVRYQEYVREIVADEAARKR